MTFWMEKIKYTDPVSDRMFFWSLGLGLGGLIISIWGLATGKSCHGDTGSTVVRVY